MRCCIVTGSRAEYGIQKPLIDKLLSDKYFEVQLIITGMHLSPEFGLTYKEIVLKGFSKFEKIEILLSSDTPVGISKAIGLGQIAFAEAYNRLKPDLIIVLGDRFEIFSAVGAALVSKIPVAHLHGGELTLGAYDESLRHSITKMSHLHFTSTEAYRKRVIQLGENPKTVFNVGALSLDNFKNMKLMTLAELEKSISFKLDKPFFVVTFHPVTLDNSTSEKQFSKLLTALDDFPDHKIIFTKPNADSDGRLIIKMIDDFVAKNCDRTTAFNSLGKLRYLSALKYCKLMIGNSSSGIIEMPMFKKPTINIGDRQQGRILPCTLIQCNPDHKSITKAIKKGLSNKFKKECKKYKSIYGSGDTAKKIKSIIKKVPLNNLIKKEFYDINFKINR